MDSGGLDGGILCSKPRIEAVFGVSCGQKEPGVGAVDQGPAQLL